MITGPAPLTGPSTVDGKLICNTCRCTLTRGINDIDERCKCRCHEAPRLYRRLARESVCESDTSPQELGL